MPEWLHKIVDKALPKAVASLEKRRVLLHWVFWPSTTLMGALFIAANGVFGFFMIGAPLLVVVLARRTGLDRIPVILLLVAGVAVIFPAFFLGLARSHQESLYGLPLVGWVMFVVWVAAYPALLGAVNRQYLADKHPGQPPEPDETAALRITMIELWMAAVAMFAVGAQLTAVVSMIALWHRQRWSAWVAWFTCLIAPLITLSSTGIAIDLGILTVMAAVYGAVAWWKAARLPFWERERVRY